MRAAGIAWRLVLCIALIAIASPRIEAQAQPVPSVAVSPASAAPGETVTLRGAGWSPGASLSARMYEAASVGGAGAWLGGALSAGLDGTFSTTGRVPTTLFGEGRRANLNVVPGTYIVAVTADTGLSASAPFTVGAPATGGLVWGQVVQRTHDSGQVDATAAPAQAQVTLTGPTATSPPIAAFTDALGRYLVSLVQPGSYGLSAVANAGDMTWSATTSIVVVRGQVARADLQLPSPGPSGTPASRIALAGATLWAAVGDRLRAFDLVDPLHPTLVGESDPLGADVRSVSLYANQAYVVLVGGGLRILEVSDPRQPVQVGSYPTPGTTRGVALAGGLVLVPVGNTVEIVDFSQPTQPRTAGNYALPSEVGGLTVAGGYGYVVTEDRTLHVVGLADPAHPQELGSTRIEGAGYLSEVAVAFGNAFGTFIFGHYTVPVVIDVSDPAHPVRRSDADSSLYSSDNFALEDGFLYTPNPALLGTGSVGAVSVGNPGAVSRAGSLGTRWDPQAIAVRHGLAYVLGGDRLLHQFDFANPAQPREVGVAAAVPPASLPAVPHDERYFPETQFRIDDDAIWDSFSARGGIPTFGYPVSRTFKFLGCPAQVFQRQIAQHCPERGVALLNVLDPELFPYRHLNGSTLPAPDEGLKASTPPTDDPSYAEDIVAFVRATVPDEWGGLPVGFGSTFFGTVRPDEGGTDDAGWLALMDLEIWGAPISPPAPDPHGAQFVYQRFQRGIMHFDAACGCTHALLLADYLKSILLGPRQAASYGASLPADLLQDAQSSRYFGQYAPGTPGWLATPSTLPGTDLSFAFAPG